MNIRKLSRSDGFTLIEIMIVVVIIGILATIAIPRLLAMRQRSMQAEAKSNLPAMLLAERAYYSEHSQYTDNLQVLLWQPEGSPRYLYGFRSDAMPPGTAMNDTAELFAAGFGSYYPTNMVNAFLAPLIESDLPLTAAVSPTDSSGNSVTVGAVGNLDDDLDLDTWTMDLLGSLTSITSDVQ